MDVECPENYNAYGDYGDYYGEDEEEEEEERFQGVWRYPLMVNTVFSGSWQEGREHLRTLAAKEKGWLRALRSLPPLTSLDLSHCQNVTGSALAGLRGLTNLTALKLSCSVHFVRIWGRPWSFYAGVGSPPLTSLTSLTSLRLVDSRMSAHLEGVMQLGALPALIDLNLDGASVGGLQALQTAFPHIHVTEDDDYSKRFSGY